MAVHWILKNTTEYRIDTMDEVEDFHKQLQEQAADGGYTLSSFSWTKKEIIKQGELFDEYYICKVQFFFNNPKETELPYFKVDFPRNDELAKEIEEW